MNQERFRFFQSKHLESDLLIGVPHEDFRQEMLNTSFKTLVRLRNLLDDFIRIYPLFASSLDPVGWSGSGEKNLTKIILPEEMQIPLEIETMFNCGLSSGTGPMSSVAGLFAEQTGVQLIKDFGLKEVVVENGGDLFLKIESDIISVIHAGNSPLSDKMAFIVTPGKWGICTSSGTMGHSFSRGKADAVTVISKNTPLADSWATALANRILNPEDIETVLEQVSDIQDISACAIIVNEQVGIRGEFELKLLS